MPIIGGGPAGMSCALWLHNYGLRPVIVEQETALGGMARRSPYPNEWLLGRPDQSARQNAANLLATSASLRWRPGSAAGRNASGARVTAFDSTLPALARQTSPCRAQLW